MPTVDALRAILLPNNLAAAITLLITATDGWWYSDDNVVLIVLASILLVSLVVTIVTLGLIWIGQRGRDTVRGAVRGAYERLENLDLGRLEEEAKPPTVRGMGPKLFVAVTILDFLGTLILLVLVPISFVKSVGQNWQGCGGVVGTIGGLVALVVHGFFLLLSFSSTFTNRYVVRIRLERRSREENYAAGARQKEGSESSSFQSMSPRPGPSGLLTGIIRHSIEAPSAEYNDEVDDDNAGEAANAESSNTNSTASTQIRMDQGEARENDRLIDDHE